MRPPGPFPEPSDRLRELAARYDVPAEDVYVGGIPGMPKMSDVISEWGAQILEPLEDAPLSLFRNGLSLSALIWNAATKPEGTASEVAAKLIDIVRKTGSAMPDELGPLLESLIDSRRRDYASDPRVVMATEAEDYGDERRIRVASAVQGPARASTD